MSEACSRPAAANFGTELGARIVLIVSPHRIEPGQLISDAA
jgi:hypothetical protein